MMLCNAQQTKAYQAMTKVFAGDSVDHPAACSPLQNCNPIKFPIYRLSSL